MIEMNIISYGWPIALLVVAHTIYQISAKSVPEAMDPFAAVFFNYVIAAALAFGLWMIMGQDRSLPTQIGKMNWAPGWRTRKRTPLCPDFILPWMQWT